MKVKKKQHSLLYYLDLLLESFLIFLQNPLLLGYLNRGRRRTKSTDEELRTEDCGNFNNPQEKAGRKSPLYYVINNLTLNFYFGRNFYIQYYDTNFGSL